MEQNEKRLGVDIPEEMWFRLNQHVPWGQKKVVYRALTRQLLDLLERTDKPQAVIGMIINDEITVEEIVQSDATE